MQRSRYVQQENYCLEADSTAAGPRRRHRRRRSEPEDLNGLDEVLKRLVMVKVLDTIGPGAVEHGQHLKRHIVYIEGQASNGWKTRNTLLRSSETVPRLVQSRRALGAGKDLGRSEPEASDELAEVEAKPYQRETAIGVYVSCGRSDTQFCLKRLSEMMSTPRKMGNLRQARLSRYLVCARRSSRSDLIIRRTGTP